MEIAAELKGIPAIVITAVALHGEATDLSDGRRVVAYTPNVDRHLLDAGRFGMAYCLRRWVAVHLVVDAGGVIVDTIAGSIEAPAKAYGDVSFTEADSTLGPLFYGDH